MGLVLTAALSSFGTQMEFALRVVKGVNCASLSAGDLHRPGDNSRQHGFWALYMGEPVEAIPYFERANRLTRPYSSIGISLARPISWLATTTAAAVFKDRIANTPNTDLSRAFLASTLGHLGRPEEARRVWQELKEINPRYSYLNYLGRLPFKNPADAAKFTDGLRKAGSRRVTAAADPRAGAAARPQKANSKADYRIKGH